MSGFVGSELMLVKLQNQAASSAVPVKILEPALFVEPWGVGVRKGDTAFRDELNGVIERRRGEIQKILDDYGVPQIDEAGR